MAAILMLFLGTVVAGAYFGLRLLTGEVSAQWVRERLADRVEAALGRGVSVDLKSAVVAREDGDTRLVLSQFTAHGPDGKRILAAPQAVVTFSPLAAVLGRFAPQRIDLVGLDLVVRASRDGGLRVSATDEPLDEAPPAGASETEAPDPRTLSRRLLAQIAAAVDLMQSDDPSIAAFEAFGLRKGRVVLQHPDPSRTITLSDITADVTRLPSGERRARFSGAGRHGRWTIESDVARSASGARRLGITIAGLSPEDLAHILRLPLRLSVGGTLNGRLEVAIAADGSAERLHGQFNLVEGAIEFPGHSHTVVPIARASLAFGLAEDRQSIRLENLSVVSGDTTIGLSGTLAADGERILMTVLQGGGQIEAATPGAPPVVVSAVSGQISWDGRKWIAEDVVVTGPDFEAKLRGSADRSPDMRALEGTLTGQAANPGAALTLWPPFMAPDVRQYLAARWKGGRLEALNVTLRMNDADIETAMSEQPTPDHSLAADFRIRGGSIRPTDGLPTIEVDVLEGKLTGQTTVLTLNGGAVAIGEQRLALRDTTATFLARDPLIGARQRMETTFAVNGPAAALAAIMGAPQIAAVVGDDLPLGVKRGRADLKITLAMPLGADVKAADIRIEGSGTFADLTVDDAFAGEALQNGNLALRFDRSLLSLKGDATLQGAPATIDLRKPLRGGQAGEVNVGLRIDEAMRARRGFGGQGIAGPIAATIRVPLGGKDARPRVELDLARAAISGWIPGWTKPAGRPGKASFAVARRGGGVDLVDFSADAAGLVLGGTVSLDSAYAFRSARFDKAKLSPGDVGKLELERSGNSWKATIRASVIDARPFLANATGGRIDDGDKGSFELDLRSEIVTGHHAEALSNVELRYARGGNDIKAFRLVGRFGGAALSGNLARRDDGAVVAVLQSANAGAALRFADLYRRMQGGTLILQTTLGATQDGVFAVRSFALRDEPALKRVLAEPSIARIPGDRADTTVQQPVQPQGSIRFDRLRADFRRSGARLDLTEAVMWGPVLGASIEGRMDFAARTLAITGTFVPAFALNNIFAKVPVLGFFLGGGEHGGLFAVNFKASGSMAAPQLVVNPLSAVAPGFLRKFFEFSRATGPEFPNARPVDPGSQR